MNGSPLFTGDAASGESEIRRWILENDLLEALIALPEQLFYNTGIATYVWVLTNWKRPDRRGRVQLIDATSFWKLLRKSLGAKRREVPFDRKQDILRLLADFEDGATRKVDRGGEKREVVVSRVYPTTHFGFRKITVERPLRLDFQASPERIARLDDERAFANLAVSRKRGAARARDEEAGCEQQATIRALLESLSDRIFLDRALFEAELSEAARKAELKLAAPLRKAILSALSERNAEAEICRDSGWSPRARSGAARHRERAPPGGCRVVLRARGENPTCPTPGSIRSAGTSRTGRSGWWATRSTSTGTSTSIARPPLEDIEADIQQVEQEIVAMLQGMTICGANHSKDRRSDASYLGGDCVGYAAQAPDVRLVWDGVSDELRVFFIANTADDATLLINLPDGSWVCNDDADGTIDPMVALRNPSQGQYDIWVGSYQRGQFISGTLSITELGIEP